MKIGVFTSNQPRHLALIESLAEIADDVLAIQECTTVFPGEVEDFYARSAVMRRYFSRVIAAEKQVFGVPRYLPANVRQVAIRMGDLSRMDLDVLGEMLGADLFVVFGASYIRGPLIDALVERKAINIHMGTSPYYRGSSCNFWALYDGRPEYVGATIHRLSSGLDSGDMLFHAFPATVDSNPFIFGMRAVQSAHRGLCQRIAEGGLLEMESVSQDKSQELRYTRNRDFNDAVADEYLRSPPAPAQMSAAVANRDPTRFVRPFFG